MISSIYVIEALLLLSGALNSGGVVPPNNHCDIENFLRANGCENLVPGFIAEEIEVRQIAQLSNQDLISLVLVCGQSVRDFASVLRQPLGSHHRFICSHF